MKNEYFQENLEKSIKITREIPDTDVHRVKLIFKQQVVCICMLKGFIKGREEKRHTIVSFVMGRIIEITN